MVTRRVSRGTPSPVEALPCGSISTISTFSPIAARAVPRLMAVVVLPTPPFWFETARTRVSWARGGFTDSTDTAKAPQCNDAAARIAARDRKLGLKLPDPTGLFQLSLGLLSLKGQAFCTALEVGLCITQKRLHCRHRARRDDIDRDRLLLGPPIDDRGGQIQRIDDGLKKTTALAQAVDQPDMGARPALQKDGQNDAGKP